MERRILGIPRELLEAFDLAARDPDVLSRIVPRFRVAKIKLTNNCNSRCLTCNYWQSTHGNELTREEVGGVLRDLRDLGVMEVMFTGGEPTLCRDLTEHVRSAVERGFTEVGLTTNALSMRAPLIRRLVEAGLTEIVLSFEGGVSHDVVRGVRGNAAKVVAALEELAALKLPGIRLPETKIAMTLMSCNLDEVDDAIELARAHGATIFFNLIDKGTYFFKGSPAGLFELKEMGEFERVIDGLVSAKRREPGLIGNTYSSLEYARRYFHDPKQGQIPCHLGFVGIDIDANGDVYSNCWGLPPVGSIRRRALSEIVGASVYRERCGAMFRKECPGCSCGYILNLAHHKPSVRFDQAQDESQVPVGIGFTGAKVAAMGSPHGI